METNESIVNTNWELLQSRRDFLELTAKAGLLAAAFPLFSSCISTNNFAQINK